jgi:hypothetical protein
MMDDHIIPECFIDTKLVNILVPPLRGEYNHQKGKGIVATKMKDDFADDFALGIIDNDKKTLEYADECDLIYQVGDELQLLKHPDCNHYFIIHTTSEQWIIELSEKAGLALEIFGLPKVSKELKKEIRTTKSDRTDSKTIEKFSRVFREIRRAKLTPILVLTHWITYLKENPYTSDLDALRAETDRLLADFGAAL